MTVIPDFTSSEERMVREALRERYDEEVDVQHADAEMHLDAADRESANCPVMFWQAEGCNFAIIKCGDSRYRCRFFYTPREPLDTGVREYEDLTECTVALLGAQADHVARERGDLEKERR
jgi:hypothetical protein